MTPLEALHDRLTACRPRNLLYLSAHPALALESDELALTIRSDVTAVAGLEHEGHYDCALVADFLEHLPKVQGLAILGRLRNLHAGRLLVFIDHNAAVEPWSLDDFLGLGFRLEATLADNTPANSARTLAFYSYDIANYNHEREWNNPRFWANPQIWGKYFW